MEHVLTLSLLSILGVNLGLLLRRIFGAPGDNDPLVDACVRLRRESPARR